MPFERFQGQGNKVSVLWIGDTEVKWKTAKNLGCGVVLSFNGLFNQAFLESSKVVVVKSSIAALKDNLFGRFDVS